MHETFENTDTAWQKRYDELQEQLETRNQIVTALEEGLAYLSDNSGNIESKLSLENMIREAEANVRETQAEIDGHMNQEEEDETPDDN